MFQLWKLVLLCGLLTGTSASVLGDLGNNLKDVIDKGPEVIGDAVGAVAEELKENLKDLQNSRIGQLSERLLQQAEGLFADAVSKVLSLKKDILGLKVSNVHILNIQAKQSPDGKGINLSIPISADVELDLPGIGKTVDLKLSMDLLSGVRIETQNGESKMPLTKCASDPASISLSLLDRRNELVNRLVDASTSFLSETLSALVQVQACPLVKLLVSSLNVDVIKYAVDKLQNETQQQLLR